jgi:heme ABC exporter ATP-binding subunit CcmA
LGGVDLRLASGEVYALLGPNGAGKTTLIRILATLEPPSAGRVRISGADICGRPAEVRRLIGVVLHQSLLYGDLTAEENLLLYARLYDLEDLRARVREALETAGLGSRAADPVRTLSRGMRQRLALARATLHRPRVLLLDEPFSGLDGWGAGYLQRVAEQQVLAGGAVLLTTHDPERALEVGDRLGILSGGRIRLEVRARGLGPSALRRLYAEATRRGCA